MVDHGVLRDIGMLMVIVCCYTLPTHSKCGISFSFLFTFFAIINF